MVNTFLIKSDFRESAKCLDTKRLGKQRVEAMQILNLIIYLKMLAQMYSEIDSSIQILPNNPYDSYVWVRKIAQMYNKLPTRLLYKNGKCEYIDKSIKMIRMGTDEVIEEESEEKTTLRNVNTGRSRKVDTDKLVKNDEIYIILGFVYHPAVLMWLHYENALKEYINVHIDEWKSRGYKNTMSKYEIQGRIDYPPWIYDDYFHMTQKSNLLQKEIERNELVHYTELEEFSDVKPGHLYFWPYTPKVSDGGICDSNRRYEIDIIIEIIP